MNTKNVAQRFASIARRSLLSMLVVLVLFASMPISKAHAWMYSSVSGRPGHVVVPTVYISDLPSGANTLSLTFYNSSTSTGPVVYRSPAAAGDQIIIGNYVLEIWNGSAWVTAARQPLGPFQRVIKANQSYVVFPNLYIQPVNKPAGYYRLTWVFMWGTSTAVTLGSLKVVSHLAPDHVCYRTSRSCQAYAGYILLR